MMNELNDDGMDARQRKVFVKKVIFSYGIDILLSVLLFIPAILGPWTKPYERPFSPTDPKISLPFDHSEIFPAWSLPLICFFIPALIIILLISAEKFKRPYAFVALVALLFSVALTDVITNILKNFTGRLRPDFLARCNPFINASGQAVCQQTKLSFVWEGRKSFPSGHASTSFAGLGLLSWFILGFTRTFNGMGYSGKFFMAILPLILASIVAISRVNDNRHHVEDVLFGSALGIVISWFVYRLYFPFPGKLSNGEPHMERFEEIKTKVLNAQSALDSSI